MDLASMKRNLEKIKLEEEIALTEETVNKAQTTNKYSSEK